VVFPREEEEGEVAGRPPLPSRGEA
jgi:hypothetical protein